MKYSEQRTASFAWHRIKDAKPPADELNDGDDSVPVIVSAGPDIIGLARWNYPQRGWTEANYEDGCYPENYDQYDEVTHWHPLPKGPQ